MFMGTFVGLKRKLILAVGAMIASAGLAGAASADTITAKVLNVNSGSPYETVNLTVGSTSYSGAISGEQHWQRTSGAPVGTSDNFNTFCIEIMQDVYLGQSYTFTLNPNLAGAPTPGNLVGGGTGGGMGSARADMIRALWAHAYPTLPDDAHRAAFQAAIWEIVYESSANPLTIGDGYFKLSASDPTEVAGDAQQYLDWLSSANLATAPQANLIALTSSTAQDQITAVPVPAPQAAVAGAALLGVLGLGKLRRRAVQPLQAV
jgi:hypothetical protein